MDTQTSATGYSRFTATDTVQLCQQTGEWNFEVSQLTQGALKAQGAMLALDGVSLLHITGSARHRQ